MVELLLLESEGMWLTTCSRTWSSHPVYETNRTNPKPKPMPKPKPEPKKRNQARVGVTPLRLVHRV